MDDFRAYKQEDRCSMKVIKCVPLADILSRGEESGVSSYTNLAEAGSYDRKPPRIVGMERSDYLNSVIAFAKASRQIFGPVRLVEFSDAIVTGQGSVITRDGLLLRESAAEFIAHKQAPSGLALEADGTYRLLQEPESCIETPAILVKRPWWRNYGHWLVDGAPILALLANDHSFPDAQIITGAHESPKMREIVRDTVQTLAPERGVLEHRDSDCWTVKTLIYVSPVHVPPLFKLPAGIQALRSAFLKDRQRPDWLRRLFVQRTRHAPRAVANAGEVASECQRRGFEIVHPENMGLAEQAHLFNDAEIIVGVKGAALTNLMFSAPSSGVLVLSPVDFPDPFFWDIAGQLGMDYAEIFGELAGQGDQSRRPFTVDISEFTLELDEMLARVSTQSKMSDYRAVQ